MAGRWEQATLCSSSASLKVREKGEICSWRSLSPLRRAMALCMRALISCEPARTCRAWARWLGSRLMEWRVSAARVYRGKAHAAPMSLRECVLVCVLVCICSSKSSAQHECMTIKETLENDCTNTCTITWLMEDKLQTSNFYIRLIIIKYIPTQIPCLKENFCII